MKRRFPLPLSVQMVASVFSVSVRSDSTALNGTVSMDRIRPGGAQGVAEHVLCDPAHSVDKMRHYRTDVVRSHSIAHVLCDPAHFMYKL